MFCLWVCAREVTPTMSCFEITSISRRKSPQDHYFFSVIRYIVQFVCRYSSPSFLFLRWKFNLLALITPSVGFLEELPTDFPSPKGKRRLKCLQLMPIMVQHPGMSDSHALLPFTTTQSGSLTFSVTLHINNQPVQKPPGTWCNRVL